MRALLVAGLAVAISLGLAGPALANPIAGGGFSSSYSGESVFLNQAAGTTGSFSGIFFNDGAVAWTPGVVGLLICLPDKVTCNVPSPNSTYASGWFSNTVYATVSTGTGAVGQNGFFTYNIAVPAGTAGSTTATFNGDVGLIALGTELRPEGYFQVNTTPAPVPTVGTLAISPTSGTVGLNATLQFTATTNQSGTVSWNVTGGCGAVTTAGLFVATATNASTQPCKVVASVGTLTASAPVSVFGNTASLSCSASPSTIAANGGDTNGVSTLTVKLVDSNGTLVNTAVSPTVTIVNNTPSLATVTPTGVVAPSAGVVTTTVKSTLTAGSIVVSVSASGLTGCSGTITSGAAGAAAKTGASFTINPIAADGASTSGLRIDVQDSGGNRVIGDNATGITVSRDSGSGSCSINGVTTGSSSSFSAGSGTATDVAGRVEFSVISTTTPGTCVFNVTANNSSIAGTSASLTTQLTGVASKLAIVANDSPHSAGSSSLTTITVDIQDSSGNRVTSSSATITATLNSSSCSGAGGGNVITASSGATSQGRAIFTFTSNGAYTACVVTFSSSGLTGQNATIVFNPGPGDHLTCAFSPPAIVKDGASTSAGVVSVRDQAGNTATDGSYSVTFSRSAGSFTTQVTTNPQTTSGGTATFQVRSTTTVGTDTYTPSITGGTTPTLPNVVANSTCQIAVTD